MLLEEVRAKQAVEDVEGLGSTLESLQAHMEGFDLSGLSFESLSLDEIMAPTEEEITQADFDKIRKEYTHSEAAKAP